MVNPNLNDPERYRLYRPLYPVTVFDGLVRELSAMGQPVQEVLRVADVGCGAGNLTRSLLNLSGLAAEVHGVDPDEGMLAEARALLPSVEFSRGSGEATGLKSGAYDVVLVGSALHWMDGERARDEFLRLLRVPGWILVCEYQFPKAVRNLDLNEWIRRGFNLKWKAPQQKPRGDFVAVTRFLRDCPELRLEEDRRVPMVLEMNALDLAGLLFSQSRFLHYERGLEEAERELRRAEITAELTSRMGGAPALFDFNLRSALFAR